MKEQIKDPHAFIHAVPSAQHVFHPNYLPNINLTSLEAYPGPLNLGGVLVLCIPITPMLYNVYLPKGDGLSNLFVYPSRL